MPEKSINEISPDLRRLFTKANEAAQRDNADYAIDLYCQILEKEPGLLECRRLLRAEQQKKAAKSTSGFFKKMMSGAGSSPQIAKAKMIAGNRFDCTTVSSGKRRFSSCARRALAADWPDNPRAMAARAITTPDGQGCFNSLYSSRRYPLSHCNWKTDR